MDNAHAQTHTRQVDAYTPVAPEDILIRLGDTVTVTNHTNNRAVLAILLLLLYMYRFCPRRGRTARRYIIILSHGHRLPHDGASALPIYLCISYTGCTEIYGFPSFETSSAAGPRSRPTNMRQARNAVYTSRTRIKVTRTWLLRQSSLAVHNDNILQVKFSYNNELPYLTEFETLAIWSILRFFIFISWK